MSETVPYSSTIAEHFRRPRNYGTLPDAAAEAEGVNPLCGDRVRLAVILDSEGSVSSARFTANACAICVAAASLLTDSVRGMSRDAAAALSDEDTLLVIGDGVPAARRRCATLPVETLRRALASAGKSHSAETRSAQ
jgi:nitrogen fixation NifU-like protein